MASDDKQTAFAVVEWLHESLGKVSADDREGIETAIQIIEEAFSVNTQDAAQKSSLSLKPASLSQVLQVYKRTKAGASNSSSGSSSSAAPGATPSTSAEHTNARDKAAAEDLKSQGNAEMAAKRYEKAIELYGQAIEKDGLNPVYYSNRAAAYSQVGKHEDAITDAKKASEVDPTFSKAYSRLGHALYCSGRYAEAAEAYENGLKHDPNNATMKSSLATAKSKAQQDDAASDDDAEDSSSPATRGAGGGAGAGGFPGMGGGAGGGMPDLASLMNNPQIMQMAQQMMGNGGMEQLMNNPMMRQMADNFRNGGGLPNMNDIMNNPQLAQMAEQFGMGGGGGGGAGAGRGAGGR